MLDAARQLFNDKGYDDTNINDIVTASGVSVGSIYHQFGGKKEVFRALADSSLDRHREVSEHAVKKAVTAGETNPLRIYVAGAKAYLLDTWKQRDIDRVSILLEGRPLRSPGRASSGRATCVGRSASPSVSHPCPTRPDTPCTGCCSAPRRS